MKGYLFLQLSSLRYGSNTEMTIYCFVILRFYHGNKSCHCRQLCECYKYQFLKWKKSALTSALSILYQNIIYLLSKLNLNMEDVYYFIIRGLTDESEILKFLQHGTLVGLLPVPHPILIRKYQVNYSHLQISNIFGLYSYKLINILYEHV